MTLRANVNRRHLAGRFLAAGLAVCLVAGAAAESPPYEFGVFPSVAMARLEDAYAPLAAGLGRVLRRPVRFRSAASFEQFMANLGAAHYDIAYVQPFDYVRIAVGAGYLPLVARPGTLEASLLVKAESPLRTIAELRGKTVALPPAVAAVSYLARAALADAGLDPEIDVTLRHFRSHDSCLQQLVIENVDACATSTPVIEEFEARMEVKLRVLGRSSSIPTPLFVVHSRLGGEVRRELRNALLSSSLSPAAQTLLQAESGGFFKEVDDADYDGVREIWARIEAVGS